MQDSCKIIARLYKIQVRFLPGPGPVRTKYLSKNIRNLGKSCKVLVRNMQGMTRQIIQESQKSCMILA